VPFIPRKAPNPRLSRPVIAWDALTPGVSTDGRAVVFNGLFSYGVGRFGPSVGQAADSWTSNYLYVPNIYVDSAESRTIVWYGICNSVYQSSHIFSVNTGALNTLYGIRIETSGITYLEYRSPALQALTQSEALILPFGTVCCIALSHGGGNNPVRVSLNGQTAGTYPWYTTPITTFSGNASFVGTGAGGPYGDTQTSAAYLFPQEMSQAQLNMITGNIMQNSLFSRQLCNVGGAVNTYTMSNATFVPGSITSAGVQAQVDLTVA
jgi:hypothetical protein